MAVSDFNDGINMDQWCYLPPFGWFSDGFPYQERPFWDAWEYHEFWRIIERPQLSSTNGNSRHHPDMSTFGIIWNDPHHRCWLLSITSSMYPPAKSIITNSILCQQQRQCERDQNKIVIYIGDGQTSSNDNTTAVGTVAALLRSSTLFSRSLSLLSSARLSHCHCLVTWLLS